MEASYILLLFLNSITIAIASYVYSELLTEPGQIFHGLYKLLQRLPVWLFKPLIGCILCVSGQWALWYYLIWNGFDNYNPVAHGLFIAITIFFSLSVHKLMMPKDEV